VLFQPGVYLVRAAAVKDLLARRQPEPGPTPASGSEPESRAVGEAGRTAAPITESEPPPHASSLAQRDKLITRVTVTLKGVPASKARDVVKVAVLPLSAVSSEVTVDMTITADGGLAGIPRETLDLVVAEGLRQLSLGDADIQIGEA
jgi:hypothetical protein